MLHISVTIFINFNQFPVDNYNSTPVNLSIILLYLLFFNFIELKLF